MKRPLILAALAAAAVAGATAYLQLQDGSGAAPGTLTLYGNVDIRQVDLAFNAEGEIAELRVEEGDAVAAGELLATLEDDLYRHAVAIAEARAGGQEAVLAKLEAGSRPQEIREAEARAEAARADLENARINYRRSRELVERESLSRQAFDEAERTLDSARARLGAAEATLDLVREGPRREDIEAARAQLEADRATLRLARYRLDQTRLTAPADGTILTRIREPGAVVLPNAPVLTLSLADPVWVRAYIDEPSLGRIRPGMPATVTTDSFPDQRYGGQVGFISPTAEFTPKSVETPELRTDLVYRLRVVVDDPRNQLRQGMPVSVHIDLADPGAQPDAAAGRD